MIILGLFFLIPPGTSAGENSTPSLQVENSTDTGNITNATPALMQNQSVSLSEEAIEKAFTGWYDQGMKALESGNYQAAYEAFVAALRLEKNSEKAQLGYARALDHLGRNRESLTIYQKVMNSSPNNTGLLIQLGKGMNAAGDYETALPVLINATALFPQETEAWNQLAAAYAGMARYEEALTTVRKSLQISLNQSEGWEQLGAVLLGQGRFYEAVAAFEKSIVLDSKNDGSWTGLGDTWTALGRFDDAASAYRKSGEIAPEKRETWLSLAKVYEKTGKTEEAASAYAKGGTVNLTAVTSKPAENREQPENSTAVKALNDTMNSTTDSEPVNASYS